MLEDVEFRTSSYSPGLARILNSEGAGQRLMPLVRTASPISSSAFEARDAVRQLPVSDAVRAGLYLYLSCWDEAHSAADIAENPDGYFWHAIVHRQEPDPGNAAYWFRRTGAHPIFPKLGAEAADRGYSAGTTWNPLAFIQFCESAAKRPGSKEERLAMEVQLLEWQLLFEHGFDHRPRGSAC